MNFIITGGQVHDSQVVEEVLDTPRAPLAVSADKAYDSKEARQQIKDEGALPVIPSRSNATKKAYCPKRFYRQRHKIENFFCRAKDWRRIATRYDKLARSDLAIPWSSGYANLLELAEACDVPVRWSCRTGVCHNCETTLIAGAVDFEPDPVEPPADGSTLICCARPHDDVVLDL